MHSTPRSGGKRFPLSFSLLFLWIESYEGLKRIGEGIHHDPLFGRSLFSYPFSGDRAIVQKVREEERERIRWQNTKATFISVCNRESKSYTFHHNLIDPEKSGDDAATPLCCSATSHPCANGKIHSHPLVDPSFFAQYACLCVCTTPLRVLMRLACMCAF